MAVEGQKGSVPPHPPPPPVNIKFGGVRKLLQNRTPKQTNQQTNNKKDSDFTVCFTKKSDATGNELSNNKWQIKIFPV